MQPKQEGEELSTQVQPRELHPKDLANKLFREIPAREPGQLDLSRYHRFMGFPRLGHPHWNVLSLQVHRNQTHGFFLRKSVMFPEQLVKSYVQGERC